VRVYPPDGTSDFLKPLENLEFRQNVKPLRAQVYLGEETDAAISSNSQLM